VTGPTLYECEGRAADQHRSARANSTRVRRLPYGHFSHWHSSERQVGMRFHCGWPTNAKRHSGFDAALTGGGHTIRAVVGNLHSTGRQPRIWTH